MGAGPFVHPKAGEEAGRWQRFLGVTHMPGPKDGLGQQETTHSASLPPGPDASLGCFSSLSAMEVI